MTVTDIYIRCLVNATEAGRAEIRFWRELVPAFDADQISIEDVRTLIGTSRWTGGRPHRSTAYRQLDQWRDKLTGLSNPGRGA